MKNADFSSPSGRIRIVLAGYLSLLLISLMVFYLIPDGVFLSIDYASPDDYQKAEAATREFYSAAQEGRLDRVPGVEVNGRWEFPFTGERLEVANSDIMPVNTLIIVQRSKGDDGSITVTSYAATSVWDGVNITEKIKSPQAGLSGGRLTLTGAPHLKLEFYRYQDIFSRQFRHMTGEQNRPSDFLGPQILYLTVSPHVRVEAVSPGINLSKAE